MHCKKFYNINHKCYNRFFHSSNICMLKYYFSIFQFSCVRFSMGGLYVKMQHASLACIIIFIDKKLCLSNHVLKTFFVTDLSSPLFLLNCCNVLEGLQIESLRFDCETNLEINLQKLNRIFMNMLSSHIMDFLNKNEISMTFYSITLLIRTIRRLIIKR